MRTEITRDGMVASQMANNFYDKNVAPLFDDLPSAETKEMFAEVLLMKAGASLYHLDKENFKARLEQIVGAIHIGVDSNENGSDT